MRLDEIGSCPNYINILETKSNDEMNMFNNPYVYNTRPGTCVLNPESNCFEGRYITQWMTGSPTNHSTSGLPDSNGSSAECSGFGTPNVELSAS